MWNLPARGRTVLSELWRTRPALGRQSRAGKPPGCHWWLAHSSNAGPGPRHPPGESRPPQADHRPLLRCHCLRRACRPHNWPAKPALCQQRASWPEGLRAQLCRRNRLTPAHSRDGQDLHGRQRGRGPLRKARRRDALHTVWHLQALARRQPPACKRRRLRHVHDGGPERAHGHLWPGTVARAAGCGRRAGRRSRTADRCPGPDHQGPHHRHGRRYQQRNHVRQAGGGRRVHRLLLQR